MQNDITALVTAEHRQAYSVYLDGKTIPAQVAGKFRASAVSRLDFPVVGDSVAVTLHDNGEQAVINEVLPRKSILLRKEVSGGHDAQPLAANIDRVFIVMGLDGNFNTARLERLLVAARDSNAAPAVILTKKDLCPEAELAEKTAAAARCAPGAEIICVCAVSGEGMESVIRLLGSGAACFAGSSGAGKSTIINRLCGYEAAATRPVREDDSRGRHTTVARQLYILPNGARIIDTPGIREFGLECAEGGLGASFPDIEELAAQCRFGNCSHDTEPGCAVKEAISGGRLPPARLKNYLKMQREMFHGQAKHDAKKRMLANRQSRAFARRCRGVLEAKRRLRGG
ncbi:MAG: ribosome small subunit-dependent GTPase A [Elusimicrobiales bacterium]